MVVIPAHRFSTGPDKTKTARYFLTGLLVISLTDLLFSLTCPGPGRISFAMQVAHPQPGDTHGMHPGTQPFRHSVNGNPFVSRGCHFQYGFNPCFTAGELKTAAPG
jgi:hypothetical protein